MRRRLSVLFILLLAARSLLPAGFMLQPSAASDGTLSIVICTGHGPQTITHDAEGKPSKSEPAKSDTSLCPYAAAASAVPSVAGSPTVASQLRYASVDYRQASEQIHAEVLLGGTSARGPPSFTR